MLSPFPPGIFRTYGFSAREFNGGGRYFTCCEEQEYDRKRGGRGALMMHYDGAALGALYS